MAIYEAGSDEWLLERNKRVTGTEVACLFGLNPYKSGNKLAKEKHSKPKRLTDNFFLRLGRVLEGLMIDYVNEVTDLTAKSAALPGEVNLKCTPDNKISCSLDGIIYKKSKEFPLECKSTTYNGFFEKWNSKIPYYYLIQLVIQMMTMGTKEGYMVLMLHTPENMDLKSLLPIIIERVIIVKVNNNVRLNNLILKETDRFYNEVLTNGAEKFTINKEYKKEVSLILDNLTKKVIFDSDLIGG